MKIIVTHMSPDWDAITSVWLIKKYVSDWHDAKVMFVPAGQRLNNAEPKVNSEESVIEKKGEDEVIHVDTGLAPLDHHQTQDRSLSAASLTWEYVQKELGGSLTDLHQEAVSRVISFVVDTDHFKEVFWTDPAADYHEFTLLGLLDGLKYQKPGQDMFYLEFGFQCLEAMVADFENRIWAEKEINEKGVKFDTRFGPGIGFETLNDTVLKLAQKMGFVLVVRKDPRKGYVRIKTLPDRDHEKGADLTLVYEQLKKIDPEATWFLHVSKKMLLNGTPKNPKMIPTSLSLADIIKVVEKI